jgi:hypothetical protein
VETEVGCLFLYVFQLLKVYEHLVSPLAQGVVQLVEEFGCKTIVREIVREISDTDSSDLMQDTSGAKAYSQFLVEVAERVPELIMPAVNALTLHLEGEVWLIILLLITKGCMYTTVLNTVYTIICRLHLFQLGTCHISNYFAAKMNLEIAAVVLQTYLLHPCVVYSVNSIYLVF